MLKNLKNAYASLLMAVCCASLLVGCAAAPVAESAPAASQAPAPVVSESVESSAEDAVGISEEVPEKISEDAAEESDVHSGSVESSPVSSIDWDRMDKDFAYNDEVYAVYYLSGIANLESLPETSSRYCVVDMRADHESYDVDWDYGFEYDNFVAAADWSRIFDIGYYEAMFPMLALQYHYDEEQLLRHFQTVGIHEGRQGSEDFNVGAYMDWCAENLPYTAEAFGGDYALYYLFYASSVGDQPASFPADGRPAQYKAVMTYSQKEEFDAVNKYRAEKGLDPYVYDSEMTAFANFRAWTNQDQELVGHTWLADHLEQSVLDLCFSGLDTETICENTIETSQLTQKAWHKNYAASKSHYEAMVNPGFCYFGTSHEYVDSVAIGRYSARGVQFDTFTDDLSTAMNP